MRVAAFTLTVLDYDEAIAFYVGKLGFALEEDTDLGGGKRWVRVCASNGGASILLARAVDDAQRASVGRQTGGRVFFFLETDDFERDFRRLVDRGVKVARASRDEAYGKVAVLEDLHGNLFDLIEPKGFAGRE